MRCGGIVEEHEVPLSSGFAMMASSLYQYCNRLGELLQSTLRMHNNFKMYM